MKDWNKYWFFKPMSAVLPEIHATVQFLSASADLQLNRPMYEAADRRHLVPKLRRHGAMSLLFHTFHGLLLN
jgi:hypothetical protein